MCENYGGEFFRSNANGGEPVQCKRGKTIFFFDQAVYSQRDTFRYIPCNGQWGRAGNSVDHIVIILFFLAEINKNGDSNVNPNIDVFEWPLIYLFPSIHTRRLIFTNSIFNVKCIIMSSCDLIAGSAGKSRILRSSRRMTKIICNYLSTRLLLLPVQY
jgi:hypothetical protein